MDITKLQKDIAQRIWHIESKMKYANYHEPEKSAEESVEELIENIMQEYGNGIALNGEKIKELIIHSIHIYNISNYGKNLYRGTAEYIRNEEELKEDNSQYFKTVDSIAAEILVQQINPQELTLDLIEKLKYNEENTKFSLYQKYLEIYVSKLNSQAIDEKLMDYLYKNNFRGNIENPAVRILYQNYCKNKENEPIIQQLREKSEAQQRIIASDGKIIKELSSSIPLIQKNVDGAKDEIIEANEKIQGINGQVQQLDDGLIKESEKSSFRIIRERIKQFFSKKRDESLSISCDDIRKGCSEVERQINTYIALNDTFDSGRLCHEFESRIKTRNRDKEAIPPTEKKEIIPEGAPKNKQGVPQIDRQSLGKYVKQLYEWNINEDVFNLLYENRYFQEIDNPTVARAYREYYEARKKEEKIEGLSNLVEEQSSLITEGEDVINKLMQKMKNLSEISRGMTNFLLSVKFKSIDVGESTRSLKRTIEDSKSKKLLSILSDRRKQKSSKTKMLPEYSQIQNSTKQKNTKLVEEMQKGEERFASVDDYNEDKQEIESMIDTRIENTKKLLHHQFDMGEPIDILLGEAGARVRGEKGLDR